MTPAAVDSPKGLPGRIVRKTAVELVLDDLRQRILCGAITPGAALRQGALADLAARGAKPIEAVPGAVLDECLAKLEAITAR